MDALVGWFDLNATTNPVGPAGGSDIPAWQQVLLYATVILGVLFSEAVAMASKGRPLVLDLSWRWIAIAALIALVVFPAVWRDLDVTGDSSLLVQMGLAAQGGVFWGVLMAGAEKRMTA